MSSMPKFPLRVIFNETGEEWVLENHDDAACNLEWFDSTDPEERAYVIDEEGRRVILRVKALEIIECALE